MSEQATEITLQDVSDRLAEVFERVRSLDDRLAQVEDRLMLVSDVDKYRRLQALLKAGEFKAADLETTQVILDTLAKQRDTLTPDDMSRFPCTVLQVIDRLWKTYSQGRFGFSVQLGLYLQLGGTIDTLRAQDVNSIQKFGERVGWRCDGKWQSESYDDWDFSLAAPEGCFPAAWWRSPYGLKMATYCFMRLLECQIPTSG